MRCFFFPFCYMTCLYDHWQFARLHGSFRRVPTGKERKGKERKLSVVLMDATWSCTQSTPACAVYASVTDSRPSMGQAQGQRPCYPPRLVLCPPLRGNTRYVGLVSLGSPVGTPTGDRVYVARDCACFCRVFVVPVRCGCASVPCVGGFAHCSVPMRARVCACACSHLRCWAPVLVYWRLEGCCWCGGACLSCVLVCAGCLLLGSVRHVLFSLALPLACSRFRVLVLRWLALVRPCVALIRSCVSPLPRIRVLPFLPASAWPCSPASAFARSSRVHAFCPFTSDGPGLLWALCSVRHFWQYHALSGIFVSPTQARWCDWLHRSHWMSSWLCVRLWHV